MMQKTKTKPQTQNKFPSSSTCTYNETICIILTRVYYCWGLPSSFEGYFVLPAAISLIPEVTARVSHIQHRVACGCTEHKRTPSEFQTVLSFHPPASISPRGARVPVTVTAGSRRALRIGCLFFCRQPNIEGQSLGVSLVLVFCFWGFFACLHCS